MRNKSQKKTRGIEIKDQSAKRVKRVPIGIAPELCLPHKKKLRKRMMQKTVPGKKRAVMMVDFFQALPLNIL